MTESLIDCDFLQNFAYENCKHYQKDSGKKVPKALDLIIISAVFHYYENCQ